MRFYNTLTTAIVDFNGLKADFVTNAGANVSNWPHVMHPTIDGFISSSSGYKAGYPNCDAWFRLIDLDPDNPKLHEKPTWDDGDMVFNSGVGPKGRYEITPEMVAKSPSEMIAVNTQVQGYAENRRIFRLAEAFSVDVIEGASSEFVQQAITSAMNTIEAEMERESVNWESAENNPATGMSDWESPAYENLQAVKKEAGRREQFGFDAKKAVQEQQLNVAPFDYPQDVIDFFDNVYDGLISP